jgi:uncharacterized protein (DUF983 family)
MRKSSNQSMDAIGSMRLQAVRCTECGETRWSLFSSFEQALARPCELCGGETERERRRPGSGPRRLPLERERRAAGPGAVPQRRTTFAG